MSKVQRSSKIVYKKSSVMQEKYQWICLNCKKIFFSRNKALNCNHGVEKPTPKPNYTLAMAKNNLKLWENRQEIDNKIPISQRNCKKSMIIYRKVQIWQIKVRKMEK